LIKKTVNSQFLNIVKYLFFISTGDKMDELELSGTDPSPV